MTSSEIADNLEEIATLLELQGANVFRIRAFNNAARVVRSVEIELSDFVEEASAGKVKGIGPAISENIQVLFNEGELPFLDELRDSFPEGLLELLNIPGLGAKKVKKLYEELEIESLSDLEEACKNEKLSDLKGFSSKTETNILESIERYRKFSSQFLYRTALEKSKEILEYLSKSKLTGKVELAGSLRRNKEVVKDIDIIATSRSPVKLMEKFTSYPSVEKIVAEGETKSSVIIEDGLGVDLRVVSEEEFAAAILHFTGSKEHNTRLRSIAIKKGLKLNEYGLFKDDTALSLDSEEAIYKELGLAWVPPELREDRSEIEEAQRLLKKKSTFARLIEVDDIKGILHAHSTYSDGKHTLEQMALAAKDLGFEYLGITDHSQTAAYAGGLKPAAVKKQHKEIDELNKKLAPFKILKGIESDILADGSLDYNEKVLESFDFIIASVHSQFNLDESAMTKRFINAIKNPYTTIIGHPTGRLLLKREAYALNIPEILSAAKEYGVSIELNANPRRLDLDWRYLSQARKLGISIPINPDAHSIEGMQNIAYGVKVARKGGLTKDESLCCMNLNSLEKFLDARRNDS